MSSYALSHPCHCPKHQGCPEPGLPILCGYCARCIHSGPGPVARFFRAMIARYAAVESERRQISELEPVRELHRPDKGEPVPIYRMADLWLCGVILTMIETPRQALYCQEAARRGLLPLHPSRVEVDTVIRDLREFERFIDETRSEMSFAEWRSQP